MFCITTKYLGPTDTKGSRIIAKCRLGKRAIPYDSVLSPRANHHRAAAELAYEHGWIGFSGLDTCEFEHGELPSEDGFAFLVPAN